MPINRSKEQFSCKSERFHILSMTVCTGDKQNRPPNYIGHKKNQDNLQKQLTVTHEEKRHHKMVQPQTEQVSAIEPWYSTLSLVCDKCHCARYVTTALRAGFCQERCSFPFRHMLYLSYTIGHHVPPSGKPPNHSKIHVWFPAGSYISTGKDEHAKFSPTLIP